MEEGGSIILTFILGIKICWAEQVVFYCSEEVGGAYPARLYCSYISSIPLFMHNK